MLWIMAQTIPRIPRLPDDWSDQQKYEYVRKMLEDYIRREQKAIDTSVGAIGVLAMILAIGLIVYLTMRFTT